jgi:integrase/recombinase XerD
MIGQAPLTSTQAQRLLATCATNSPIDLRDRALLIVGFETGMLRKSLAGMQLETTTDTSTRVPVRGVERSVPLSNAAIYALDAWRRWLRSQKITKGPVFRALMRRVARGGKLIYEVGEGLALVSIYKIVVHRADQAGLTHVHPHVFRDTFIAWRLEAGLTPFQIAAVTGHKINLPSMGKTGSFTDALDDEARNSTPTWLVDLLRKP